jgi:hypothetical protein
LNSLAAVPAYGEVLMLWLISSGYLWSYELKLAYAAALKSATLAERAGQPSIAATSYARVAKTIVRGGLGPVFTWRQVDHILKIIEVLMITYKAWLPPLLCIKL